MTLSYNISANLKQYLNKIEKLRVEILLYPISTSDEAKLKWNVINERGDRNVFNFIKEEWYVSAKPITFEVIKDLYEITTNKKLTKASGFTDYSEKRINVFLTYIQQSNDNPIIQAAIAQAEILEIKPFIDVSGKIARFMSYVMLYKYGLDFRGMLNLNEFYETDNKTYRKMVEGVQKNSNLTVWLEYFSYGIMVSLEKVLNNIKKIQEEKTDNNKFRLNSRQLKILEEFDKPNAKMTNRIVQKLYKVSQITASRDLSKLAETGLLFSHGKGRAVFYVKA
ncbi:hypothetical protein BH10PAT1_BH10PAT1_1160 [soil metagenome]